ncbi:Na(+)-translocating NADH-quinone reductase subunit A [Suttonella sp. R2A3]|uniref:Na(+)-translocating NADH-quinone reductase subunit A n=1 Tax=Suttonella sp. R2A3 TaxID=2908648 RepID=UPI001F26F96B|nr:Na(+)-translocating NADH-quinone reductase subunit A [Suttonella sp. R2A3]UJF24127.1 Na(+)-translocating NADH-quinone reductase subunit A [Suttonella sp. R2A3]
MISIKKGIDLPISGGISDTTIHSVTPDARVAVLGDDFVGLKPTMNVAEGDRVKAGQALFEDKKNPGVMICSPVAGVVDAIERGERRRLLSVIIKPEGDEAVSYAPCTDVSKLEREAVVERLRESGVWPVLRTRPFNKTPALEAKPYAIFVNTMDTNPLSFDPTLVLEGREDDYLVGLQVLQQLTEGKVHVCHRPNAPLPVQQFARVAQHAFAGIHPAGLVGTHIHFVEPVGPEKQVWHLGLQDLLAVGHLFRTGTIDNHRVVAIAGPGVKKPKLVKTLRGIDAKALLGDNLQDGKQRVISGSVFAGRKMEEATFFLGGYDQQISVLPEGEDSILLEFVRPGMSSYSRTRAYLGRFLNGKKLPFTTAMQGSPRPILPFGIYEDVMALDILPTLLLKALAVKDTDSAIALGALELDEEDIALLTYVDPGKHDFGAILRENLTLIEKEG